MIVSIKDSLKLVGITIVTFCAVFVCTLFLNYNFDLAEVRPLIENPQQMAFYDAQVVMGKVICAISGGCLLLTSMVLLFFYIKQYIASHQKHLGILKAMGYSSIWAAKSFGIFGLSVFVGGVSGFAASFLLMPMFYDTQNGDILPKTTISFHPSVLCYLVVLPTLFFGAIAILYALLRLRQPAMELLRGEQYLSAPKGKNVGKRQNNLPFLSVLKKNTAKSHRTLLFLVAFASFCFSSMMQMTTRMDELASPMFSAILMIIGITLSSVTLILAVSTVVHASAKSVSMMKVFGYSFRECAVAVLGGYRPIAYIGFAVGTVYQHMLLTIVLDFFADTEQAIEGFSFSISSFLLVLAAFILLYELTMFLFAQKIRKIPVKEIMLED